MPSTSTDSPGLRLVDAFERALSLQQRGEVAKAEAIYRRILEAVPDHAASVHCLGLARSQRGDIAGALTHLRRAVELDPAHATFRSNLGAVLAQAGRLEEAVVACREAVRLDPALADAHANLGVALEGRGRLEEAVSAYRRAIELKPGLVATYGSLAGVLHRLGRAGEAEEACRAAVASNPDRPEAFAVMGSGLQAQGRLDQAIAALRGATERWPQNAGLHARLGSALTEAGHLKEAEASYRLAVELQPRFAEAHNNLGILLRERGAYAQSAAAYRSAIAINPGFAEAYNNLGRVLRDLGALEESCAACRKAIALNPDLPDAHCNLGLALLMGGNFAEGWPEYDWRLERPPKPPTVPGVPVWSGEDPAGKTILVRGDQGIGDQIMFSGLIGDLVRRGAHCIVEADRRMEPLLRRSLPLAGFLPAGDPATAGPPGLDCQVAMASLPRWLRSDIASFAGHGAYLRPDPDHVERLRGRYRQHYPGRRLVGLSWRGGTGHLVRMRSIALERWGPILRTPDVGFVSLQYGDHAAEIAALEQRLGCAVLRDPEVDPLASMDALAAQIAAMDLVISIDNSTVHMAGALGAPVWVLLAKVPNWRWLLAGETSHWYPSMRLFRQTAPGEWSEVLERVARELAQLAPIGPP